MKLIFHVLFSFSVTVAFAAQKGFLDFETSGETEPGKKYRIVLVGNTLIAHESKDAFLEAALTARWPSKDITFRNLGWPGDDVFGTARSSFGSAQNTRSWQPPHCGQTRR
jgi:hypothetical protein